MSRPVRVRFAPSPSGDLHVGNIRSALFNYAYARHHGGAFVFRVEDTDRQRTTEESYRGLLEDMRWLGFDWDEGPEVGGPHAPYRQSERFDLYAEIAGKLMKDGSAYQCYCTREEVDARNAAAGRPPGYDGHCRTLSQARRAEFEVEGRQPVVRFAMPGTPIEFADLIRGDVRFEPEHVPDYVLVRGDGFPLYTLTNPVDDALMEISHVLRGEDLLPSTPRQIALYDAMIRAGVIDGGVPEFGHLPFVLGQGNQKLSKRNTPEVSLAHLREIGYLPEAVLNYLALLGWSFGDDQELFTLDEMCATFTLDRVSRNPARFDPTKFAVINGVKLRELDHAEFARRVTPFLVRAGLVNDPPTLEQNQTIDAAVPLIAERVSVLTDAVDLLWFLFVDEADFAVEPETAAKQLTESTAPTLAAALDALTPVEPWEAGGIDAALRASLVERLGLKPRVAFGPVRAAATGKRVSPPLFESLELLGRDRTLRRLGAAAGPSEGE